jgi:LysR family glycine cleavage system transcriptional activator
MHVHPLRLVGLNQHRCSALLTQAEVADGSLIEPFEMALPLTSGYYLIHPRVTELRAGANTRKTWFVETEARSWQGKRAA